MRLHTSSRDLVTLQPFVQKMASLVSPYFYLQQITPQNLLSRAPTPLVEYRCQTVTKVASHVIYKCRNITPAVSDI